jgi:cyanophycin synthase-like protein
MTAPLPNPVEEIRLTTLHSARGANFWSTRPVTRMDVTVGAFDQISSADAPGFTDSLVAALPGLDQHACSIGEPGGFIIRLRRGTYAPHIIEHVALELQTMIGHDVGFGRTRGGDEPGEYTIVFEHQHEQVGLRAAAHALAVVQRGFSGTLTPAEVTAAVRELEALARTPEAPPLTQRVLAAVTGDFGRTECVALLHDTLGDDDQTLIVDVAPSFILEQGLPYARSALAIILDAKPSDVPPRYREPERARRLVATLIDAVPRRGFVVCPADEPELQEEIRREGCLVAVFCTNGDIDARVLEVATAVGRVRDGSIWLEHCGDAECAGPLRPDVPPPAQVAAALAAYVRRGAAVSR